MPNVQYCTNEVPHHTFGIMVLHCMTGYSKKILFLVGFEFRLCIFKRWNVNVQYKMVQMVKEILKFIAVIFSFCKLCLSG